MRIRLAGNADRHLVLDKSILQDPRLSFRAKGLLAYLLAHPELDLSSKRKLASVSLEGVDALDTAFKELKEAGYFRQTKELDEGGALQTIGIVYPISRIPLLESQRFEKPVPTELLRMNENTSPSEQEGRGTAAQRIIDRLNELRKQSWDWARYTPLSAKYVKNVEHINGRLGDGYAESDLILVLEYLATVDSGKEESRKYFDCVTPFNTKNFERNLAMARDWEARGRPAGQFSRSLQLGESHDAEIYEERLTGGKA